MTQKAEGERMNCRVAPVLPQSLLDRIDRFAQRMRDTVGGADFSRNDAIRVLLTRSLDVLMPEPPAKEVRSHG